MFRKKFLIFSADGKKITMYINILIYSKSKGVQCQYLHNFLHLFYFSLSFLQTLAEKHWNHHLERHNNVFTVILFKLNGDVKVHIQINSYDDQDIIEIIAYQVKASFQITWLLDTNPYMVQR